MNTVVREPLVDVAALTALLRKAAAEQAAIEEYARRTTPGRPRGGATP